ncbi:hypothetical protein [Terrabacter sp. 2RAF25]|uniref:hypothetical protein n=1 Tax=Terrabacter sp. 2RAF25 TaxID=3232998 RepID=UPI003F9CABCB
MGDGLAAVAVRGDVRGADPDALFVAAFLAGVELFAVETFVAGVAFFVAPPLPDPAADLAAGTAFVATFVAATLCFDGAFFVGLAFFTVAFAAGAVFAVVLAAGAFFAVVFAVVALVALFAAPFAAPFVAAFFAGDDFVPTAFVGAAVAAPALVALRPAARATAPFTAPAALAAVRATAVRAFVPLADAALPVWLVAGLFLAALLAVDPGGETFCAPAVFVAPAVRFAAVAFVVAFVSAPVLLVAVERVAAVAAAVVFFAAIRSSVARAVDADKWG